MKRFTIILITTGLAMGLLSCNQFGIYFTTDEDLKAKDTPIGPVLPSLPTVFALPDSGQITCSSGAGGDGAMAACPQTVTGQDGDYVDTPSACHLA